MATWSEFSESRDNLLNAATFLVETVRPASGVDAEILSVVVQLMLAAQAIDGRKDQDGFYGGDSARTVRVMAEFARRTNPANKPLVDDCGVVMRKLSEIAQQQQEGPTPILKSA